MSRYREVSTFAVAFASEYKGFMKAHGVTNTQIAAKLGRNDGYVSERANGRRPLDTDDVDALASLVDGWSGPALMDELARRTRLGLPRSEDNVIRPDFGHPDAGNSDEDDEPEDYDDSEAVARETDPEPTDEQ